MKKILFKILKYGFISVVILILLAFAAIKYILWSMSPTIYKKPKYYKAVKEQIVEQNKIKHFPEEIPADATEVQFLGYTQMPYDGEMLLLNFKTNKTYIDNELKKNEFWNKNDKLGQKQDIYFVPKVTKDFKEQDYTYYVIKDDDNKNYYKKYFPYFSGIGISKDANKILYYYIFPAD